MPTTEELTFTVENPEEPSRTCIQVTDLSPGQTYSVQIRGRDGERTGLWSLRLVADTGEAVVDPLDPVTNLNISVVGADWFVTWTNPTDGASGVPANLKDVELEFNTQAPPATGVDSQYAYVDGEAFLLTNEQVLEWFGAGVTTIYVTARSRDTSGNLSTGVTASATKTFSGGLEQRSHTFVVAANNSSAKGKASADYVCDGVDDDLTIQQAIDALAGHGGMIQLLEGEYHCSGPISEISSPVTIAGQGMSTMLSWQAVDWTGAVSTDLITLQIFASTGTTGFPASIPEAGVLRDVSLYTDMTTEADKYFICDYVFNVTAEGSLSGEVNKFVDGFVAEGAMTLNLDNECQATNVEMLDGGTLELQGDNSVSGVRVSHLNALSGGSRATISGSYIETSFILDQANSNVSGTHVDGTFSMDNSECSFVGVHFDGPVTATSGSSNMYASCYFDSTVDTTNMTNCDFLSCNFDSTVSADGNSNRWHACTFDGDLVIDGDNNIFTGCTSPDATDDVTITANADATRWGPTNYVGGVFTNNGTNTSPLPTKGNIMVGDGTNFVPVGVGNNGDVLTADSVETAGVKWASGASGGGAEGYVETVGDASATGFDITHNLGSTDLIVNVWDVSGTDDEKTYPTIKMTDTNTVRVEFITAPGVNERKVVIITI